MQLHVHSGDGCRNVRNDSLMIVNRKHVYIVRKASLKMTGTCVRHTFIVKFVINEFMKIYNGMHVCHEVTKNIHNVHTYI